jgi:hypothetical protein
MKKYMRFVFGLRKYFKNRISPEEAIEQARKILKERVSHRQENFLTLMERGVYNYKRSPYLPLLRNQKIALEDIKKWIVSEGIKQTLLKLQSEGIYFTVDEFKGKIKVERKGLKFETNEKAFDNPFVSEAYEVRSGATRSAGTRIRIDYDYLTQRSLYDAFILNLHGSLTSPIANWFPVFPGAPGINSSLRFARIGNPPRRWFSQVEKSNLKVNWEKRWGVGYIFFMSRLMGVPLAKPEYVSLNKAHDVARWAAAMLQEFPNCVIYTFASSAVRVCMAAQEADLNIRGTRFLVTGEPLTPQKKKEIEETGGRAVPIYGISEAGVIAAGCPQPYPDSDSCHFLKDTNAIITHRLMPSHSDTEVDSFLFTSLLYESPKILLNVGMGDYGKVWSEPCSCEFGTMGFDVHVSRIRSYEKLTGEGVTFVDTDFINIIENELPRRFGGQSTDYQLVEEEDARGLTRLRLFISPRVGKVDEQEVAEAFIQLLRKGECSPESWAQSGSDIWAQARTLRIKREFPIPTRSGKILPFHIVKPL